MHILVLDRRRRPHDAPVDKLTDAGHFATRVRSPEDAFASVASASPPDVLLCDMSTVGPSCLELIRKIRGELARTAVYVIAVMAKEDEARFLGAALKAGIDDFVTRPVLDEALLHRLVVCQRIRGFGDDPFSAHGRLVFMATHDPLTNLWNRSSISGHLYRAMARAQRDGSTLSVIMCDVDHFKNVNDTRGHIVGDEVLRDVAGRLRSVVRPHDLVGRYGGEEFVILVPGCTPDMALEVAERARRAIAATPIATFAGPLEVTISVGVASLADVFAKSADDNRGDGPQSLVAATDRAMYAAKAAGRNRVVVWSGDDAKTDAA